MKRVKWFLSFLMVSFILCISMLPSLTAQAQTFTFHLPSFGLYSENANAIQSGDVIFNLADFQPNNLATSSHSRYQIKSVVGQTEHFEIPFIGTALEVPEFTVSANGKAVSGRVCYGDSFFSYDELDLKEGLQTIVSSEIDESRIGTLYTVTPTEETVELTIERENGLNYIRHFIYTRSTHYASGKDVFTFEKAQVTNAPSSYIFFITDGDAEVTATGAEVVKESMSCKAYVDRAYNEFKEFYDEMGGVPVEFIYSQFNSAKYESTLDGLFFDSVSKYRLMTYEFDVVSEAEIYEIEYEQHGVRILDNSRFSPYVYMIEQKAAGSYGVTYSFGLSENYPFVLESSSAAQKGDGIYTVKEEGERFYFVFSSTERPKDLFEPEKMDNTKMIVCIVLSCVGGVAFIVACIGFGFIIRDRVKSSKERR